MDYAVGSVAALISGNVTPNRPRLIRRALTPTKHQSSPNVTPKSESVDDRSIFLSPSLQKKKAIVKKSPKRIFQNPDLDVTNDGEGSSATQSPKADKVKKHLKEDLKADENIRMSPKSPKSPKKGKNKLDKAIDTNTPKKKLNVSENEDTIATEVQNVNESTPKKKKKQKNSISMPVKEEKENLMQQNIETEISTDKTKSPKKKRKSEDFIKENTEINVSKEENELTPKKKRKKKMSETLETNNTTESIKPVPQNNVENQQQSKKKKKNKKNKNKAKMQNNEASITTDKQNTVTESTEKQSSPKKKKKNIKNTVNPNAITNKDSDSEHESDDEIQSENEQTNNEILATEAAESSDDANEDVKQPQNQEKKERTQENAEDEVKRTLFVGNVPFSNKCKKEIKKIFDKYGEIETVRIRTVPVKDARMTPKLAVIKNELHPERTTVNVYVKFKDASSVDAALVENNTVLNENHLRVTRSDTTGSEHDPHKAIFVGNLPFAIEDDALRAKFERCGEIESVRVVRDNKTNAGKGFGYVNFTSKDGVELALAMSEEDLTIKNRILRVKRCTDTSNKKGPRPGNPGRKPGKFQDNQRNQGSGRSQGMKKRSQEGNQGSFRNEGSFRNQGNRGRNQGSFGRNQGNFGRNQGFGRPQGNEDRSLGQDGAHRRILKKRHNEEGGGPASKQPRAAQPAREKKPRKEFVGVTAEKKKKHKFNKGDKKKKALSEILTKHNV